MKKKKLAIVAEGFQMTNAGPRGLSNVKTPAEVEAERVKREADILGMLNLQLGQVENTLKKPFDAAPKFVVEVADINGALNSNVIDENTPELLDAPQKEE
jgi:hypothetical protein